MVREIFQPMHGRVGISTVREWPVCSLVSRAVPSVVLSIDSVRNGGGCFSRLGDYGINDGLAFGGLDSVTWRSHRQCCNGTSLRGDGSRTSPHTLIDLGRTNCPATLLDLLQFLE